MRREFRHLAHIVVPFLETEARETQRRLSSAPVLLGQVDGELVQDLLVGALHGAVKRTVTVHDDEPERLVIHEQLIQGLGVELVVAQVEGRIDGLERLEVDIHAPLLALVGHHCGSKCV